MTATRHYAYATTAEPVILIQEFKLDGGCRAAQGRPVGRNIPPASCRTPIVYRTVVRYSRGMTTKTSTPTTIELDIATMEGKTWLAQITGLDDRMGFDRAFLRAIEKHTSKSGKTGYATYVVTDGLYESNEGRRRLGRRYWSVAGGVVTEVDTVLDMITLVQATS